MHHHHWLRRLAWLLLATAVAAILLIHSGIFDPRPTGSLMWQQPLPSQTVPALSAQTWWLDEAVPDGNYTVRLTAAHEAGELDSGYGLLLGDDAYALAVAVSPLGYTAVWQARAGQEPEFLLPWQPWPHVQTGQAANEIWVTVQENEVTVRLNREWLWTGPVDPIAGRPGLYGESFGRAVTIDYRTLELFADGR